jgi:peptide/nickel transport system ATP-binding protein
MTDSANPSTILELQDLYKRFDISGDFLDQLSFEKGRLTRKREHVHAINGVSFKVAKGEALCIVGESGCGKSTIARCVMGLIKPTSGKILYNGERIDNLSPSELMPYRKRLQMVFQNPYASLNPRMTIKQILEEPVRFHTPNLNDSEVMQKVEQVMLSVGVDPGWAARYPHEFSGGQKQRISLARALTVDPEFIVADEPISALDVSVQAQVINLLLEKQKELDLTYLFITHDLSVVEHFGTRVAVMYLGTLCELSDTKTLFENPKHPYTRALLSAIPKLDTKGSDFIRLNGEVPTPVNLPSGCVFHGRCPHANERCKQEIPKGIPQSDGSLIACHAVEESRIS